MLEEFRQKSDEICLKVCEELGLNPREITKALSNRPLLMKFDALLRKKQAKSKATPSSKEIFAKPKKADRPSNLDKRIKIFDKITFDTGNQMSFIQIDLKTNGVIGIHESLAGVSRALDINKNTLRYRLQKRPIQKGYLIKQIERIKFCKGCDRWLVDKERYKYTLDSGAVQLSSKCKICTCTEKKEKRVKCKVS